MLRLLATASSGERSPLPRSTIGGAGGTGYSAPVVTITDPDAAQAPTADGNAASVAPSPAASASSSTECRGLGPAGANNIIQAHGSASTSRLLFPKLVTFSGQAADYYEIALVEYTEKMHSDLPPTKLRGYVQLSTPGVLAAIAADESASCQQACCPWACKLLLSIIPITWAPSSLHRGEYTA